jgi:hypothetical protein
MTTKKKTTSKPKTARKSANLIGKSLTKPAAKKAATRALDRLARDLDGAVIEHGARLRPLRGAKATIIDMIAAKGGVTEPEICKALGWARAGATISRAIKLAPFKVAKAKDEDGRTRYSRA